jgi:hypothetical protein
MVFNSYHLMSLLTILTLPVKHAAMSKE